MACFDRVEKEERERRLFHVHYKLRNFAVKCFFREGPRKTVLPNDRPPPGEILHSLNNINKIQIYLTINFNF